MSTLRKQVKDDDQDSKKVKEMRALYSRKPKTTKTGDDEKSSEESESN